METLNTNIDDYTKAELLELVDYLVKLRMMKSQKHSTVS